MRPKSREVCATERCSGSHYALGLCKKHYRRQYRQRPEAKEAARIYRERPENRERAREVAREYCRARRRDPAYREASNRYRRETRDNPNARARERRHAAKLRIRHPERARAYRICRSAISRGDLVRPEVCERCGVSPPKRRDGVTQVQAHHADYSKPLEVEWLCPRCHLKVSRALGEE